MVVDIEAEIDHVLYQSTCSVKPGNGHGIDAIIYKEQTEYNKILRIII